MNIFRIILVAACLTFAGAAQAETKAACIDIETVSAVRLVGTLTKQAPPSYAAFPLMGKPYYTLELDKPVCADSEFSGHVENIRSVYVGVSSAFVRRYQGKRVSALLKSVIDEETHWHLRPLNGEIVAIAPVDKRKAE